jgi:hypothetical protein
VSPTAGRSGHPWGRIANGSRRGQQILTGLFFAGPPNPNSLSLYSTAAVRRRRHDRGAMGGSGRTARVDVDDRPAPHRSGDGSRAVIEWTHFKTSAGTVLRGDEWYVFDSRSGLIREIGAYYASPQSADLDRLELGGFDYAARGYACEPPFVRADNAPEAP